MAYPFFESGIAIMAKSPNDYYRELQQAFIDEQWANTSAKTPENGGGIFEQTYIGSDDYCCIEAWVKPTVADTTRGLTDTRDYLKLIFRDINHETVRGLFYKFDKCYWIVHAYTHFNGLVQDVGIRRCNNYLRIKDDESGDIFKIPCVVDYEMMSPGNQINRYIITPNGHITVITQGNDDTLRLLKLNKRFVFDGRVFRLNAFQNSLQYDMDEEKPTILYLDMYLDEQHAGDDLENKVADNSSEEYADADSFADYASKLLGGQ